MPAQPAARPSGMPARPSSSASNSTLWRFWARVAPTLASMPSMRVRSARLMEKALRARDTAPIRITASTTPIRL